jgi:hypothetical protein
MILSGPLRGPLIGVHRKRTTSARPVRQLGEESQLGDLAVAKRVVESLHKSPWQCSAAAQLALAHIKANDVKSAIAIVGQTTSWVGKGHDLGRVAVALIDAGDVPAAKEVLKNLDLSEKEDDAQAYCEVGRAMIEIGRAAELKTWLSEMPTKSAAAYACLGAAEELQEKSNEPR